MTIFGHMFADIAASLGDSTRTAMVESLMDGRAQTATELALVGNVAPSTASSHLSKLVKANIIQVVRQGRHRYYRIASPEVAALVEQLLTLGAVINTQYGPKDPQLRKLRVCYDHMAGEYAVQIFRNLLSSRVLLGNDTDFRISEIGYNWFENHNIKVDHLSSLRRPLCRSCLDWSERRMHLAGSLGNVLLESFLQRRWIERALDSRALVIRPEGETFFASLNTNQ